MYYKMTFVLVEVICCLLLFASFSCSVYLVPWNFNYNEMCYCLDSHYYWYYSIWAVYVRSCNFCVFGC